ncbi:MAG: hypothetical protein E7537_03980 [Ruminococcaceae bacterium]|nr:hypothetical protein [Oscillospiraceae bacterium]
MIYFLSDLHGDLNFKPFFDYLETAKQDDLLIILGDVGIEFEKTAENKEFSKKFLSSNKKIAFLDGNHENFEFINSFSLDNWNGGKVHRLSENIVHLMRGEIYKINGKTFFTFGGCKSSAKWKEMGLWFDGEEGTEEEFHNAYKNLENHNNKVDYILTHKRERREYKDGVSQPLYDLCMFIEDNVKFQCWYSGHWHVKQKFDDKHIALYDELVELK